MKNEDMDKNCKELRDEVFLKYPVFWACFVYISFVVIILVSAYNFDDFGVFMGKYQVLIATIGAILAASIAYNGAVANVKYQQKKDLEQRNREECEVFPSEIIYNIIRSKKFLSRGFIELEKKDLEIVAKDLFIDIPIKESVEILEFFLKSLEIEKIKKYSEIFECFLEFKINLNYEMLKINKIIFLIESNIEKIDNIVQEGNNRLLSENEEVLRRIFSENISYQFVNLVDSFNQIDSFLTKLEDGIILDKIFEKKMNQFKLLFNKVGLS